MRRLHFICIVWLLAGLSAGLARAETFKLNDGRILSGEVVSYDDSGIILRLPEGGYSERTAWDKFSQDDLKTLAKNPKIAQHAEPFIEPVEEPRPKPVIQIDETKVPRLERPQARSLLGALFSSSVGLVVLLLLYAANIYAAYEVSIFRSRPAGLVCGLAAIPFLGFLAPMAFLALPTQVKEPEEEILETGAPPSATPTFAVPSAEPVSSEASAPGEHGGLKLAHDEPAKPAPGAPSAQVFQRGAFTFNRRFFETKFPGFFGVVRRESEKNLVLTIKSTRGEFTVERVTRISSNDLHAEVHKGHASEEITIPFSEIQEVTLKPKTREA